MLEVVVFLSGALVMILEMVGSRVLAPHLGTSLIVWTSLIGVVLAFLALGAWLGGRLADKYLSFKRLSAILSGAGLCTVATAILHPVVGQAVAANISNLHLATLAATVLLLALPGLFFGMVSPYVIRLRLNNLQTSGQTVGRLYALSTAGSILGTFMGGFVLISWFSTTQILFGVAVSMLLLGLLVFPKAKVKGLAMIALVVGLGFFNHSYVKQAQEKQDGYIELIETPYNTLTIMRGYLDNSKRLMRFLITDPGSCQSGIYIDNPNELALSYTRFYALGPEFNPQAKNVLMLGGGGYSVPRWLLSNQSKLNPETLQLDVVEIDPGITKTAKDKFTLPEDSRMNIYHQDARTYLNHNTKKYDLIFVDVFGSYYSIPFHMGTKEAMGKLREAMTEDGIVVMNIISALEGEQGRIFSAIHQAMNEYFPEVHVFGVRSGQRRQEVQNIMVMAFGKKRPDLASTFASKPQDVPGDAKTIPHMLARHVSNLKLDTVAMTDAYAPVERYMLPMIERNR